MSRLDVFGSGTPVSTLGPGTKWRPSVMLKGKSRSFDGQGPQGRRAACSLHKETLL